MTDPARRPLSQPAADAYAALGLSPVAEWCAEFDAVNEWAAQVPALTAWIIELDRKDDLDD